MINKPDESGEPGKEVVGTVTSTRQKDPKRVEAGRRLAQISKQIREQRMMERIESERVQHWSSDYLGYLVGIAGLILAGISVYYARADYNRQGTQGESPKEKPDGLADGDSFAVKITKHRARVEPKSYLDTLDTLG